MHWSAAVLSLSSSTEQELTQSQEPYPNSTDVIIQVLDKYVMISMQNWSNQYTERA